MTKFPSYFENTQSIVLNRVKHFLPTDRIKSERFLEYAYITCFPKCQKHLEIVGLWFIFYFAVDDILDKYPMKELPLALKNCILGEENYCENFNSESQFEKLIDCFVDLCKELFIQSEKHFSNNVFQLLLVYHKRWVDQLFRLFSSREKEETMCEKEEWDYNTWLNERQTDSYSDFGLILAAGCRQENNKIDLGVFESEIGVQLRQKSFLILILQHEVDSFTKEIVESSVTRSYRNLLYIFMKNNHVFLNEGKKMCRELMEKTKKEYELIVSSLEKDSSLYQLAEICSEEVEACIEFTKITTRYNVNVKNIIYSQETALLFQPFNYIHSLQGKGFRNKFIEHLSSYLNLENDKIEFIKEGIENLHEASLLLDDIQDSSKLRRGKPSAHEVYGEAFTLNCANYVVLKSISQLASQSKNSNLAMKICLEELQEMYIEQGLDIFWRNNLLIPTKEEYYEMVKQKTGGLFRLAFKLLLIEANNCDNNEKDIATTTLQSQVINDCNELSVLFQIIDDLKNICGYENQKGFCEDLEEGKISYLIIEAASCNVDIKEKTIELLRNKDKAETKDKYLELLKENKVMERVEKEVNERIEKLKEKNWILPLLYFLNFTSVNKYIYENLPFNEFELSFRCFILEALNLKCLDVVLNLLFIQTTVLERYYKEDAFVRKTDCQQKLTTCIKWLAKLPFTIPLDTPTIKEVEEEVEEVESIDLATNITTNGEENLLATNSLFSGSLEELNNLKDLTENVIMGTDEESNEDDYYYL
ncbi:hypothetical protein ABK040_001834 [Willaertia magna]